MPVFKKVLYLFALFLFSILLFSFISNLTLHRSGFNKKEFLKPRPFQASQETNYADRYADLEKELRDVSFERFHFDRDLFQEKKEIKAEPLFVLSDIKQEEVPILFKGSIVKGDEVVIAQINWGNKTHFVKPDEVIKGWRILEISKEYVTTESPAGERITLELNKTSHTEELTASILVTKTDQVYRVKVGDQISGYKVMSLGKDEVVLTNPNSELIIKKD